MPGLLRGVARTAVIAGTATPCPTACRAARPPLVGAGAGAVPAADSSTPPPPPAEDDRDKQIAQLKELADLKAQGILTEEEFAAQKAEILGG